MIKASGLLCWLANFWSSTTYCDAQDLFIQASMGPNAASANNQTHFSTQGGSTSSKDLGLKGVGNMTTNVHDPTLGVKHDHWVFSISIKTAPMLCLDLPAGRTDNGNTLQIWECNGQESQLWFFDAGTYEIRYGGDETKCVYAGSSKQAGTQLMIWECNQQSQQKWGYDSNKGTIFLFDSESDASLCMDLAGGKTEGGTAIQVWNCNNLWEQAWNLMSGIGIRPLHDYHICLDLQGGNTNNGSPIDLWTCNGLQNQHWLFESGTNAIRYAADPTKCIDAGNPQAGTKLMLWDCNNMKQQQWGYDLNMGTIYLSASNSDATLCMDITAGSFSSGNLMEIWNCNNCWNQQFQVIGPSSKAGSRFGVPHTDSHFSNASTVDVVRQRAFLGKDVHTVRRLQPQVQGGCPPFPGPSPSPPPPGPGPAPPPPGPVPGPSKWVYPEHCNSDDAPGWPQFNTPQDLAKSQWGNYFKAVYGGIPNSGYPICIGSLTYLVFPALQRAGIQKTPLNGCGSNDGDYYKTMPCCQLQSPGSSWIQNFKYRTALPSNRWVEGIHKSFWADNGCGWYFYAPGSAVWLWLGNTKAYDDHSDAIKDISGKHCSGQCESYFKDMCQIGAGKGIDSVQFLKHSDMACGMKTAHPMTSQGGRGLNGGIEIVDTRGTGAKAGGCAAANGYKAGWEGSQTCNCDSSISWSNCKGFGDCQNGNCNR